jgi:hypothetical protein
MYFSERTTKDHPKAREYWVDLRRVQSRVCAKAIKDQRIPSLRLLIELDYREFYEPRDTLNHILGMCLAAVLIENRESSIRGRLSILLERIAVNGSPWSALSSTYPVEFLRNLWVAEIETRAEGGE